MKKISIVVPCYNDSATIEKLHTKVQKLFSNELLQYDYEIIFSDDCSPDNTWDEIKKVCANDKRAIGIHNISNFGAVRNLYAALTHGRGDAVFMIMGDMQEPIELLPEFIKKWENGSLVTVGQKKTTKDGCLMRFARRAYYNIIDKFALKSQIQDFTGYGLYDKKFIDVVRSIDDMQPCIKGIVSEYGGYKVEKVMYDVLPQTRKSNFNFIRNYDYAMIGITGYAKNLLRMCTFVGVGIGVVALLFTIYTIVNKLMNWDTYPLGIPTIICGIFFLSAIQLFFMGIIGEYLLSINERTMKRPMVVHDMCLNLENDVEKRV